LLEEPGAFEHHVDAELLPGQLRRILLRADANPVAVHDEVVAVHLHGAGKAAVRGVVLRQVRVGLRIAEVVERDDLQVMLLAALVMGAQDVAADAAVAVDGDFDGHALLLKIANRSRASPPRRRCRR
jgi:hypothetical protein